MYKGLTMNIPHNQYFIQGTGSSLTSNVGDYYEEHVLIRSYLICITPNSITWCPMGGGGSILK